MAKTANLYVRIEPDVKEQAETILSALGIPASNAITMFYKQIILRRGLPFDVKMPVNILLDASTLSAEQMDAELQKGYDDMQNGRTKSHKKMIAARFIFTSVKTWCRMRVDFGNTRKSNMYAKRFENCKNGMILAQASKQASKQADL